LQNNNIPIQEALWTPRRISKQVHKLTHHSKNAEGKDKEKNLKAEKKITQPGASGSHL
jgi:hypothetical protein